MKYGYGEYEGEPFQTPDSLFASPKLVQFILKYGQQALDAMEDVDDEDAQAWIEQMIASGLLERDDSSGALRLTPKMLRGLQHRALLEIFRDMRTGTREGHLSRDRGRSDERTEGTRPYSFGDKMSELDVAATMRNALHRARQSTSDGPLNLPLSITPADFELHQTEGQTDTAMCLLLDMSGSMMRYGRFFQAKRVALGMAELMRSRFPQDTIDFVGFYSLAERIAEKDLPLVMPKPVSIYDSQVRIRVPMADVEHQQGRLPEHFTNLHLGLRMARQILQRRGASEKQIFVITDGQPTAHVEPGPSGDEMLYLLYPPSERSTDATLKEALRCHQQGIRIATYALIEDYWGMDWVGFVDRMTRLVRGMAYYCSSDDLASTIIESYITGKKRKTFIA